MKFKLPSLPKLPKLPKKPCIYCGEEVRYPFKKHSECSRKHSDGLKSITFETSKCLFEHGDLGQLAFTVKEVAATSFVSEDQQKERMAKGFSEAIKSMLNYKMTKADETVISHFIEYFSELRDLIQVDKYVEKAEKIRFINQIRDGKIPTLDLMDGDPFFKNLMKGEHMVYVCPKEVRYFRRMMRAEKDIVTAVEHAANIFSTWSDIKPQNPDQLKFEDFGSLAITTKHIYFSSVKESFRIRFDSIAKVIPYTHGVEVHKHSVGEKPKLFMDTDGTFLYELIKALIESKS
jgi:hypothetical protein